MDHQHLARLVLASAIGAALSPAAWATGVNAVSAQAPTAAPAAQLAASVPLHAHDAARAQQQTNASASSDQNNQQSTTSGNENQQRASQSNAKSLQTIVVTAAQTGGVKKLDASYSIVTADLQEMKMANPITTADLLKISPGIWPESSGGQSAANIEVAGFPSSGDAPFFTMMVNGTPLYGMPSLSFMDSSTFVRLDDTVKRVEVVQGGPGAVFGPGQIGATANFILRTGTPTLSGEFGLTYGDQSNTQRVDAFVGFPVGGGWLGSIGGFYRKASGVRAPGFPADKGGQLTMTLSRQFDHGKVMLWFRELNDRNQFLTDIPVIQTDNGGFASYPGFDALTGTFESRALQHVLVPDPRGFMKSANLANGRGTRMHFFGGTLQRSFNDAWQVSDHFIYDGGHLFTNALFAGPNPKPLGYYLYGCNIEQAAGWCVNGNPTDSDTLGYPAGRVVSATLPDGSAVPLSRNVIHQGWWDIHKKLENFINDLRVNYTAGDNTVTGGLYFASYTDHDNWSLGNQQLMLAQSNSKPIMVTYHDQGGQLITVANNQGFVDMNANFDILENGHGNNVAFYMGDSWKPGKWLVQIGARVERLNVHWNQCNLTTADIDGDPNTLYDNSVSVCDGTYTRKHYHKWHPAFTAGVNYAFTDNMSAYVRWNRGAHFPDFDNGIRSGAPTGSEFAPMQKIKNIEGGFKYQSRFMFLDASVYQRRFTGLVSAAFDSNGQLTGSSTIFGAKTYGLDVNAVVRPTENFHVNVVGDYMHGRYRGFPGCQLFTDVNGNSVCLTPNGAPLARQPKYRFSITPNYTLPGAWGSVTAYVTYRRAGQRYQGRFGVQPLGSYHMWDAGIVANFGPHWQARLWGTNLTNEIAITEGNARVLGNASGVGGVFMARPFQGRSVNLQVKYFFF